MVEKKRARGKGGKFKGDDPSTPENEAWEEVKPKAITAERIIFLNLLIIHSSLNLFFIITFKHK